VTVTGDKAREMAKASDARRAAGTVGALEGIPLGIKDLFGTEGVHTQACSHVLDGFKPRYESTVTANLWADGAVMLGKLNMDEFAMGSSNETSYYGPVINPGAPEQEGSNADLVPGGSSGGSAAAVSAMLCAGATATDTGGSIRQPAAFTGTVGIKPTYGRCSRWGMVAFASSLDQAGPIARDVRDAAILLKSRWPRSMTRTPPRSTCRCPTTRLHLAVGQGPEDRGIPREYRMDGMPGEIERSGSRGLPGSRMRAPRSSTSSCRTPNTRCRPITSSPLPKPRQTWPAMTACVTACACPARTLPTCMRRPAPKDFGQEVKRRIMIGTYVLSAGYYDAYYLRAQKVRTLIKRDFEMAFDAGVDAILTPATPSSAFADRRRGRPRIRSRCISTTSSP
jgi:aspartyl-tRNA(Asn)/glutamyl-tRNA(Gln) amidotransferase subunit A